MDNDKSRWTDTLRLIVRAYDALETRATRVCLARVAKHSDCAGFDPRVKAGVEPVPVQAVQIRRIRTAAGHQHKISQLPNGSPGSPRAQAVEHEDARGRQLVDRAIPVGHVGQEVVGAQPAAEGRWACGSQARAKCRGLAGCQG